MFIEISKTPIERIEEFVNHHNNWTQFFTEEEVKKCGMMMKYLEKI